jgi:hypothetical protein
VDVCFCCHRVAEKDTMSCCMECGSDLCLEYDVCENKCSCDYIAEAELLLEGQNVA